MAIHGNSNPISIDLTKKNSPFFIHSQSAIAGSRGQVLQHGSHRGLALKIRDVHSRVAHSSVGLKFRLDPFASIPNCPFCEYNESRFQIFWGRVFDYKSEAWYRILSVIFAFDLQLMEIR